MINETKIGSLFQKMNIAMVNRNVSGSNKKQRTLMSANLSKKISTNISLVDVFRGPEMATLGQYLLAFKGKQLASQSEEMRIQKASHL